MGKGDKKAIDIQLLNLGLGFSGSSDGKESACNVGGPHSIPGLGRPPEKGMATDSSVLAWRIPWTEDSYGQSTGSQCWTWISDY